MITDMTTFPCISAKRYYYNLIITLKITTLIMHWRTALLGLLIVLNEMNILLINMLLSYGAQWTSPAENGFPLQYLHIYSVSLLYVKLLTLKYTSLESCSESIHNVT